MRWWDWALFSLALALLLVVVLVGVSGCCAGPWAWLAGQLQACCHAER